MHSYFEKYKKNEKNAGVTMLLCNFAGKIAQ
jgi:hypothetical protein